MTKPTLLIAFEDYLKAQFISTLSQELLFETVEIITNSDVLLPSIQENLPEFVFLDSSISEFGMIGIIKRLKRLGINTKVILYSNSSDPTFLEISQSLGVRGIIMKGCSIEELKMCLKSILKGNRVFYTFDSKNVQPFNHIYRKNLSFANLTDREMEVYVLIKNGKTEKELSSELDISINTVKSHKGNIFRKLNIKGIKEIKLSKN
jgi:DNA-binding NarL/FixJ family response regulator